MDLMEKLKDQTNALLSKLLSQPNSETATCRGEQSTSPLNGSHWRRVLLYCKATFEERKIKNVNTISVTEK